MDTILVVDDNQDVLFLVRSTLEDAGYKCLNAADGAEAKSILEHKQEQITTILLDRQMPKMDGMELLRWIKTKLAFKDIPVVMQTVMDRPEDIKEGIDAGAFYYLPKLTDPELLLSIVNAAVADFRRNEALLKKIKKGTNPFKLLLEGTFRFQTLAEGEALAIGIANASASPDNVVALSELIANAVEHGNLNISYQEKTLLLQENTFYKEIKRRLALPEYADKYAQLTIKRDSDQMTVFIKDEGPGFDYEKYLELDESRAFHTHGRGIALANMFLELEYLGKGNELRVAVPVE